MVKEINSQQEFKETIGGNLVCVDYFAHWCGPCKQIAPMVDQLEKKYEKIKFVKVDVDKLNDIAQQEGIRAMPTFKFYSKGVCIETCNSRELEQNLEKHKDKAGSAGSGSSAFSGTGYKMSDGVNGGGGGGGGAAKPAGVETAEELRAKRLAAYGGGNSNSTNNSNTQSFGAKLNEMQNNSDRMDTKLSGLADKQASNSHPPAAAAAAPRGPSVDPAQLATLLEYGFPEGPSRKALSQSNNDVEAAVLLLVDNPDFGLDAEPSPPVAKVTSSTSTAPLTSSAASSSSSQSTQQSNTSASTSSNSSMQGGATATTQTESADSSAGTEEDPLVPLPVDDAVLAQVIGMGYTDCRARKGLFYTDNNLARCLEWLDEHSRDPTIDQEFLVKKSEAEAHVASKVPLTPEQKAEKLRLYEAKIKKAREDRAKKEKEDERLRELARRQSGQSLIQIEQERERMQRKRVAELQAKEKSDAAKEKQRLLAELAADKERRKANAGRLPSVLGVDGYNPSAVQYDQAVDKVPTTSAPSMSSASTLPTPPVARTTTASSSSGGAAAPKPAAPIATADPDKCINMISAFKVGNEGLSALGFLSLIYNNIVSNPSEEKYRSINMEGKAFTEKLGSARAISRTFFVSSGFAVDESGTKLVYKGDAAKLRPFVDKLEAAKAAYKPM